MAEEVLLGVIAGIKLAVFVVFLTYVYLADIPFKSKKIHWLNLVAIAFIAMAIGEFLHVLGMVKTDYVLWPWIISSHNLHLFSDILYLAVVGGLLFFLHHLDKNAKDYK